jgi:hypothetical protein
VAAMISSAFIFLVIGIVELVIVPVISFFMGRYFQKIFG